MTEFVLVRHGETDWNATGRLQGFSDVPLNQRGIEQARQAADGLRDTAWDVVISSPLQRAYQTAVEIVRELGRDENEIITHLHLRERTYGLAEGLTIAERQEQFPDDIWPNAETPQQMNERAGTALGEIAETYAGKRILVVTHGGWIRAALRVVSNFDKRVTDREIPNTSRTYLSHDGERWIIGDICLLPNEAPVYHP